MSKQIMCSLFCPMLNKFGVCESTMRRVERVQECPPFLVAELDASDELVIEPDFEQVFF